MNEVAATASVIARLRAEESARSPADRLFEDPFAPLFIGDDVAAAIATRYGQVPFFREQVIVRTRFIDDALRAALATGAQQVLLLGAGFDCRALRLSEVAAARAVVFEIDLAEQLAHKRSILGGAGHAVPPWDRYVAADFTAPDFETPLRADLRTASYRPETRTFVVWEGVITYLDDTAIDRTMRFIATATAAGSEVVFNYLRSRIAPETLPARFAPLGFSGVRTWPLADLYRQYHRGAAPPPEAEAGAAEFHIALATV